MVQKPIQCRPGDPSVLATLPRHNATPANALGSPYLPGMDDRIALVVAEIALEELQTTLRLANLFVWARRMSEPEWFAWRRAILSRLDLPPVSMRPQ